MTVTDDDQQREHPLGVPTSSEPASARQVINEMLDAGLLDEVMDRVDSGGLTLTGAGGFLPEMIKAVLERGLQSELTGHLGYEKGDWGGRGSPSHGAVHPVPGLHTRAPQDHLHDQPKRA